MPQKFQTERRYVNTFLKMLFYTHVLRRFDKPKDQRREDNLLILWADEAQRFMAASEEGMSDYNSVDVIREAQGTLVAAAQSSTSFIPPLGKDKAKVLTLNQRKRESQGVPMGPGSSTALLAGGLQRRDEASGKDGNLPRANHSTSSTTPRRGDGARRAGPRSE